ncbi:MAG: VCBS repeat-containing protein [Acidobacteria bacterium]|nr:VCBS repeat-containing protein [Acidobacteriota bacterium]
MNKQKNFLNLPVSKSLYLITIFAFAILLLSGELKSAYAQAPAATGILQICKTTEGAGLENNVFQFRIGSLIVQVPTGTCSNLIELPVGSVIVEELLDGFTLPSGTFSGRFRLLNVTSSVAGSLGMVDLPARTVVVNIREGGIENKTVVTFTNTPAINAVIEICKRAAPNESPSVTGSFDFTIDVLPNTIITVSVNGCSGPIQINVPQTLLNGFGIGDITVTELGREGFRLESVTVTSSGTSNSINLLNELVLGQGVRNTPACIDERRDLITNAVLPRFTLPADCFFANTGGGFVSGDVFEGGVASQTTFTFFNGNRRTAFDYDGDGRADISVYRPSTNRWFELLSSNLQVAEQTFGISADIIAPADYDGDGKTDIAIFRPSTGTWWYLSSIDNVQKAVRWGKSGDIPRPSDFDGDGRDEFVLYRPSENRWYRLSHTGQTSSIQFGIAGDFPLIGDFDGDGKDDIAVYRPSTGDWWYIASATGSTNTVHFGISTDKVVPADYDGDGKNDFAVYRAAEGNWYINGSSNNLTTITKFGLPADKPVPADYDGDGRADIAVYRPSEGVWYILRSSQGFAAFQLGVSTDFPTPAAFIP